MGHNCDTDITIYTQQKPQAVLAWLKQNDQLGFCFDTQPTLPTRPTIIEGDSHQHGERDCLTYDTIAFCRAIQYRFNACIKLEMTWLEHGERDLFFFGQQRDIKAVEHSLGSMIKSLCAIEPYRAPDRIGDLTDDLNDLQTIITKIHAKAKDALQGSWF